MAQSLTIAPAGLWTDPNPLSAAPDGAMAEALNVVISRPGVVEPRPGLFDSGNATWLVDEDIIRLIEFEDDLLVVTKDASDGTGHVYWVNANDDMVQAGSFIGASSAWTFTAGQVHGAVLGGNLYITCGEGVFRCSAPGDDYAYRAGLPRPAQAQVANATTGGVNYPVTQNSAVAWRLCETATAGRLTIRSAPSARIVQRSYTGASNKQNTLTFANTTTNVTEVYRSSALATDDPDEPTDEMVMVGTAAASAASFTDDEAFSDFVGPALYTNATQQGALVENGITPLCRDVAAFRDMLFFGAARWAPSLTFEVLGFGPAWRGTNNATANRLTSFTITGTPAGVGSDTVNTVSATDIAKVRAGMRVYLDSSDPTSADAVFAAATYVQTVNTGAGTFTVSPVILSAPGASTIRLSDWIEVSIVDDSGTTTERVFCDDASGTNYVDAREFQASTTADVRGAQQMAYELSDELNGKATVSAFGDGVTGAWTFIVETYAADVTSLTVKTSNANAISSRIDGTTGKAGASRGSVATLAWSKPGEPEHVPPGYTIEIGAPDQAIMRVIPTRDALFVFKEDGVWRVSGYSPDTLQVDEFDRTIRIVSPDTVCEWDGRVAAWTSDGVVLIGDEGAENIGLPIGNLLEDKIAVLIGGGGESGLFIAAWRQMGMLLLGVPASSGDGYAQYVYCWCKRTRAWSRWTHSERITCIAEQSYTRYLWVGTKAADASTRAKLLVSINLPQYYYDRTYSVTVSGVSGTTVTISAGSGWTPAVGDILDQSGTNYAVTAVASSTVFTVHASGVTAGSRTAYTRASMQVAWTVRDGENPGAQKLFREATAIFGTAAGLVANDNAFTTDRSTTESTNSASLSYTTSDVATTIRTRIPRESRRCTRLTHEMTFKGALPGWQLHGVSYVFNPHSTRLRDAS